MGNHQDDDFECLSRSHNLRRAPFDTSQWLIGVPCLNKVDFTCLDVIMTSLPLLTIIKGKID